jgi:putative heme transporter
VVSHVLSRLRRRMATDQPPGGAVRSSSPLPPAAATPLATPGRISRPLRDAADGAAGGDVYVPTALRTSAALGWRFLVVVAALYVIGMAAGYLAAVVVPVAIALLLAALLVPAVHWLQDRNVPRGVATALVMIGGLALVGGVLTFVVLTFVRGVPELASQLTTSVDAVVAWLTNGPLRLSEQQLRGVQEQVLATVSANQASITAGAITTATTVGEIVTETLLVVFTLIFFLQGGAGIWQFLLGAVPEPSRMRADVAGRRALAALVSYVRATAVVAVVDAVAIGIGLAVLGVPLAVPLAALVFLGAFVPIVGAVLAGGVAVLIALVAQGPITALIVLGIIIAIMQLESHVLQPVLLGRAVKLHPLAVVLAIASGLLVAGIAGALLAVPLLAVLNSGIRSLRSEADHFVDPQDVHTSEPEDTGPADPELDREPELSRNGRDDPEPADRG